MITSAFKPYSTRYREGMNYYNVDSVDGGAARLIVPTPHLPIGKRAGDGPAWSPDGKPIAFVSNEFLYVMPIDADRRCRLGAAADHHRARPIRSAGPDRLASSTWPPIA